MAEVRDPSKLKVFISYSRQDAVFADDLEVGLKALGFDVLIDRQLSGGEAWKATLAEYIRQCDTVVFLLSPKSAKSDMCQWEVDQATNHSKRILPAICESLTNEPVPEALKGLQYIFFTGGRNFRGLLDLRDALNRDLEWIYEHTRYADLAHRWMTGDRSTDRLMSGKDIEEAKAWTARWRSPAPEVTALQREFITASEQAQHVRDSDRERQLIEREQLLKRAEAAYAERELALKAAEAARVEAEKWLGRFTLSASVVGVQAIAGLVLWLSSRGNLGIGSLIAIWGFISIISALLGGIVARQKKRRLWVWATLAYCFPPTLLLLLILPRRPREPERATPSATT